MGKHYIYINWFSNVEHLDINQYIYDTTEQPQEISLLFPKVTEDVFRPEDVTEKDREEIKKETDRLRNEQETRLDPAENHYINSLDHNDWKEINQYLVEQNGEDPPLRIKNLFDKELKKAVFLEKETKIYIKASDVGLQSVNNYGDIGSFWIGNLIPPNDVRIGDTIIEFTVPKHTRALILSDGTYVLDQSAFEIKKQGMYYTNGRTEKFVAGKIVDQTHITELLEYDQLIQKSKLTGAYQEKNVFAKNKAVFSLEEVKGPYASFFLEKFFPDPAVINTITDMTNNIPTDLLSSLVDFIDIEKKGFIRFTTKEIPYGVHPEKRIVP